MKHHQHESWEIPAIAVVSTLIWDMDVSNYSSKMDDNEEHLLFLKLSNHAQQWKEWRHIL